MSQAQKYAAPRYPALDGLRGIAILAVFLCHYADSPATEGRVGHAIFWWGWMGVDVFFVLSGFLITGILFDSLSSQRYFRNFYIRRTLRIFPLVYGIWAVFLLLTPFMHVAWNRYVVAQMFYLGNWVAYGAAFGRHPSPGLLFVNGVPIVFGQYWTLCVEEQFYLIWPIVVYLVRDRVRLLRVAVGGAVLILMIRCLVFAVDHRIAPFFYNNSLTRFDTLLLGAAAALWLRGEPHHQILSSRAYAWMFFAPLLTLAALIMFFLHVRPGEILETSSPPFTTVGFTLIGIASLGVLLAALDERTLAHRLLRARWLTSLGTLSYGFYVIHALPLRILSERHFIGAGAYSPSKYLIPICAFPCFYALAWLSYRYIETPFLKMKDRFAPSPRPTNVEEVLETAVASSR